MLIACLVGGGGGGGGGAGGGGGEPLKNKMALHIFDDAGIAAADLFI